MSPGKVINKTFAQIEQRRQLIVSAEKLDELDCQPSTSKVRYGIVHLILTLLPPHTHRERERERERKRERDLHTRERALLLCQLCRFCFLL